MRFLFTTVLLLAAAFFASAEVLFTRTSAPAGWTMRARATPERPSSFMLGLKQRNLEQLEAKFWSVSNPKSPLYRNFLTADQVLNVIAPADGDRQEVFNWLLTNGVAADQVTDFGDAFEVKTSVAISEKLFSTQMYEFYHPETDNTVVRQFGSFSLPDFIRPLVELVTGISTFPMPHYAAHKARNVNAADLGIVAQTIYTQYNIPAETPGADVKVTSQGVIEFEGQTFSAEDLVQYSSLLGITVSPVPSDQIIGPNVDVGQTEATLDIDFIATVNVEASNWFWIEDGNNWLYAFGVHFFNTTDVPQVISISYGWYEGAQCDINPTECSSLGVDSVAYVQRVNTEFQKIGLRGVSILVSSGDAGAHTRTDEFCSSKDLRAEFPASSPYVTSVGATQLQDATPLASQPAICTQWGAACAASGTEVAVSFDVADFTSGGGFSQIAAQPSYQTKAVSQYLASGIALPPATYYNATGRAGPDVSALGHNNLIYQEGVLAVGGTSASAPIFAAVVALLNEASLKSSGKTLGFLNPLLYQMWEEQPNTFNDVLTGDNKCTEYGCFSTCQGWLATKGWDPVTGLGTPNYQNILAYIQNQL